MKNGLALYDIDTADRNLFTSIGVAIMIQQLKNFCKIDNSVAMDLKLFKSVFLKDINNIVGVIM